MMSSGPNNKYAIMAWRSRLLGTMKLAGIDWTECVDWAPVRIARMIIIHAPEAWTCWLEKFPNADVDQLAALTGGDEGDVDFGEYEWIKSRRSESGSAAVHMAGGEPSRRNSQEEG